MLILGVDPGIERIGYGLVRREGSRLTAVRFGLIETPKINLPDRLRLIYEQLGLLMQETDPDALVTERLMFSVNRKTAMDVAKGIGVVLLAGAQRGLACVEYTPPEIKQAVVGTGAADKKQVQFMVTKLLSLPETPKPDDVADALAIAICHAFRSRVNI